MRVVSTPRLRGSGLSSAPAVCKVPTGEYYVQDVVA